MKRVELPSGTEVIDVDDVFKWRVRAMRRLCWTECADHEADN
jgi:hypothetical protein